PQPQDMRQIQLQQQVHQQRIQPTQNTHYYQQQHQQSMPPQFDHPKSLRYQGQGQGEDQPSFGWEIQPMLGSDRDSLQIYQQISSRAYCNEDDALVAGRIRRLSMPALRPSSPFRQQGLTVGEAGLLNNRVGVPMSSMSFGEEDSPMRQMVSSQHQNRQQFALTNPGG
ncbi:hypothetical protein BGZ99_001416, partial [Dissophora globulifera]